MAFITVGTENSTPIELYYEDQGTGQPVVLIHGYPLDGHSWERQTRALLADGYRVITYDRRGFGQSSKVGAGYDYDTFAADLHAVMETLDLQDVVLVGHSTGGGEVTRYIGRHGTDRVAKVVLVGAVPPLMLQTDANPGGLPIAAFDAIRAGVTADRSQFYKDLSEPFYGANRPGAQVSAGVREAFWLQSMQVGLKAALDCIRAFSETDLTEDLARIDVPVLFIHGDDDQIVPIGAASLRAVEMVPNGTLKIYPGGDHALPTTHQQAFNADLLEFLQAG